MTFYSEENVNDAVADHANKTMEALQKLTDVLKAISYASPPLIAEHATAGEQVAKIVDSLAGMAEALDLEGYDWLEKPTA